MQLAYFDLASGASGDMIMAALADAGRKLGIDAEGAMSEAVSSLDLACTVTFLDDERGGLACRRAEVKTDGANHRPSRLQESIEGADVPEAIRRRALGGLRLLVEAEAAVHGRSTEEIHLHELGSADTAADLIGAAAGIDALRVSAVAAAPVPVPHGWTRTDHGPLPLPAPVTLEVLKDALVRGVDTADEIVTPTGAAILVAHEATFGPLPQIVLNGVGVGGGSRQTDRPNVCRVLIGTPAQTADEPDLETSVLLETNIDDQTPESVGHAVTSLLAAGALDAWLTPIVMKKSRPAYQLSVLARPADEANLLEAIFRATTTLGVRRMEVDRRTLPRSHMTVTVAGGEIRVKVATLRGRVVNVAPEFDDCAAAAERSDRAVKDVYAEAMDVARRRLDPTA